MSKDFVIDKSSLHDFRTEVPNIIFNLKLDPYEKALYLEYKRVAGDKGACWQSNQTIAENLQMSIRKLQSTKQVLAKPRKELNGKSLITITPRKRDDNGDTSDLVTIVDIWEENALMFLETRKKERGTPHAPDAPPPVHDMHPPGAPGAPKEEHSKKNNIKKDNVRTMPYSKKKRESEGARFLKSLTKEQRELHDKVVAYKPNWGDPPKSEDVCAWFLAKKYTLEQVATALKVYQQDAAEAQAKGRVINNMGGSIVSAIKNRRAPKNQDFEANKQMAKVACKDIREMRVLDKYVSYRIGNDEIQIMYNLPIQTFTNQLGDAKRKLLMECGV